MQRFYYINKDAKIVRHYAAMPEETPEGFLLCGLSEMQIPAAAGFYTQNQPGYTIEDGDPEEEKTDESDSVQQDRRVSGDPEEKGSDEPT